MRLTSIGLRFGDSQYTGTTSFLSYFDSQYVGICVRFQSFTLDFYKSIASKDPKVQTYDLQNEERDKISYYTSIPITNQPHISSKIINF